MALSEKERIKLGARLRQARELAGIKTAAEAAKLTKIHVQNVRDHEAGRRGADIDHLDTYASIYKVDYVWLATGRGQPNKAESADTAEVIEIWSHIPDETERKAWLQMGRAISKKETK